jgi:hypothetical protein
MTSENYVKHCKGTGNRPELSCSEGVKETRGQCEVRLGVLTEVAMKI